MGRIKGATMEVKTIIEDFQMQAIIGMRAASELWERAMIPSLLSGAGTWFGLKANKKVIEMCDNLQNFFWRVMLAVPESCPKIALRCETGMMGIKWRIWKAKIMLLMRIRKQEKSSLATQVFEEMDQGHCIRCPAWAELRKDLDLTNISDLVIFFRKLLSERARLEAENVEQTASHDS